jgi:hypothetical protein
MSVMVRKQIYIEPRQEELLKQAAAETGMTEAEIIRRAIDLWGESEEKRRQAQEAWKEARAFIEDLIAQGPVPGGRTWTREELYEERLSRYGRDSG